MRNARADTGGLVRSGGLQTGPVRVKPECCDPTPSNDPPLTGWPAFSSACRHSG